MQERIFSIFTTSSGNFFFASSKGKEARTRNTGSRGSQLNDIFSSPSRWKFHKFSICCTNDDFNSFPHFPTSCFTLHAALLLISARRVEYENSIWANLSATFCAIVKINYTVEFDFLSLTILLFIAKLTSAWASSKERKLEEICEICQAENRVKHLSSSTTSAAAFLSSWRNNEDDKLKF